MCPGPCTCGFRVCTRVSCTRGMSVPHTAGPTSARVGRVQQGLAPLRSSGPYRGHHRHPRATAWGLVFVWVPWEWQVALGTVSPPLHTPCPLQSRLHAAGLRDEAGGVLAPEPGCPSLGSQPSCFAEGPPELGPWGRSLSHGGRQSGVPSPGGTPRALATSHVEGGLRPVAARRARLPSSPAGCSSPRSQRQGGGPDRRGLGNSAQRTGRSPTKVLIT